MTREKSSPASYTYHDNALFQLVLSTHDYVRTVESSSWDQGQALRTFATIPYTIVGTPTHSALWFFTTPPLNYTQN